MKSKGLEKLVMKSSLVLMMYAYVQMLTVVYVMRFVFLQNWKCY